MFDSRCKPELGWISCLLDLYAGDGPEEFGQVNSYQLQGKERIIVESTKVECAVY
jgi:hypothetical protein